MEQGHQETSPPRRVFERPEEELAYLRERIARLEHEERMRRAATNQSFAEMPTPEESYENVARREIKEYHALPDEEVLAPELKMTIDEIEERVIALSPDHAKKIDELAELLQKKGIKNALKVVTALDDPHIEDDFHRFLIQYILADETAAPKKYDEIGRALRMVLYEVTLPELQEEGAGGYASLVGAMEQFFEGMRSIGSEKGKGLYYALELAYSNFSEEVVFYVAVPREKAALFEKMLLASFPHATATECKKDYNIFNQNGISLGSTATFERHGAYPIKTYTELEQDPLAVMLNIFDKVNRDGEGAAIQIIYKPTGLEINQELDSALKEIKRGTPPAEALRSSAAKIGLAILATTKEILFGTDSKRKDTDEPQVDTEAVELISEKISSPIMRANIRLVSSAATADRAEALLADLESAFNQFERQRSNRLVWKRKKGNKLKELLHNYTFRIFNRNEELWFNLKEATTLLHFPVTHVNAPSLRQSVLQTAPAPMEMDRSGIVLGVNRYRGVERTVYIGREDRMRHMYVIGQTGVGKTVLLKNMIVQDIRNGDGVCYIDPHGSDIEDILRSIPPERIRDVIYFDPSDTRRPMGLNMLEHDRDKPEQKAFVVNEMLSIFNKLFDMKVAGGPMFEQYFRNATMLVIEDPDTGNTLLDVARVLADESYRKLKLARCKNQLVVQFWRDIASKAGGESSLQNMVPYITNKFDVFLSNDVMRMIVSQERSAFNFRDVMDTRKILLVNLSKGRLGDINAHLIGLILVGKILMAALSRVDALDMSKEGGKPADFFLYIDEFQNVTTDSISAILSEARKYRLGLTIAHQFIAQLEDGIRDAVFGNVGSMAVFRVGVEDAQFIENQFQPVFSAYDLMRTPNWNAYVKMLVNGFPAKPFNMATLPPPEGDAAIASVVKEYSVRTYGTDRNEIERAIAVKYRTRSSARTSRPAAASGAPPAHLPRTAGTQVAPNGGPNRTTTSASAPDGFARDDSHPSAVAHMTSTGAPIWQRPSTSPRAVPHRANFPSRHEPAAADRAKSPAVSSDAQGDAGSPVPFRPQLADVPRYGTASRQTRPVHPPDEI